MELWLHDPGHNRHERLTVQDPVITIGRDPGNSVKLSGPFVAPQHAKVFREGNRLMLTALTRAGTRVANRPVEAQQTVPVEFGDEIVIGPYSLALVGGSGAVNGRQADRAQRRQAAQDRVLMLQQELHTRVLERLNLRVTGRLDKDDQRFVQQVRLHLAELARQATASLDADLLDTVIREELARRCFVEVARLCEGRVSSEYREAEGDALDEHHRQTVSRWVTAVVEAMPLLLEPTSVQEDLAAAEDDFENLYEEFGNRLGETARRALCAAVLIKEVDDTLFGLGPLSDLLAMPSVTEIMVVGKDAIYIEKQGRISRTQRAFYSDEVLISIIERILAPVGRRVDTSNPMVDARLPDGSRINAVISPLSLVGPTLTIRKFGWVPFTMEDLVARRALSDPASKFLQACIMSRQNVIITGGTGSGKTTLLNVLSSFSHPDERIITIEESAELQLPQPHVVRLEARPSNVEGKGAATIRDLVRNALRMRPERIIVGEVRGAESLDMLQAMNTGHDGSLSTLHANNPEDAMKRLETLVLMAVDMPVRAIREQIVSALDMVVQTARLPDGRRRVTHISEVTGINDDGHILLDDLFVLPDDDTQDLRHTGRLPSFIDTLLHRGSMDLSVFF